VRSSANINSGAQSKTSTIAHGILLLTTVIIIPGLLQLIPLASLAGILIIIGFKLTKPALYKEMYKHGMSQFLPFIITVAAVVFTNLLQGVFMGIAVAVFFILKTNFKQAVIMVNNENNYLIRFTKDVSFLHKASLRESLEKVPKDSTLTVDGSQSHFIDHDIIETLTDFQEESKTRNIQVELVNIHNHYH
jgi:MFS superfamily sulfate permease-like transporter